MSLKQFFALHKTQPPFLPKTQDSFNLFHFKITSIHTVENNMD